MRSPLGVGTALSATSLILQLAAVRALTTHARITPRCERPRRPFHVVLGTDDSLYEQWQSRVAYYHYKKQKMADGPCGDMGGFTRLLHSGREDSLMDEIPTVVVGRLSHKAEAGYAPNNRPFGLVQLFSAKKQAIVRARLVEDYVLLIDPDYIFARPMPNLAAEHGLPVAFDYWYMRIGNHTASREFARRYLKRARALANPGGASLSGELDDAAVQQVQPIGGAPVLLRRDLLRQLAPVWLALAMELRRDKSVVAGITAAGAANDWVTEMWAYSFAAAGAGVKHLTSQSLLWELNSQSSLAPSTTNERPEAASAYLLHYAFPIGYDAKGALRLTHSASDLWHFRKQDYMSSRPPAPYPPPPPGGDPAVARFIQLLNEAEASLPGW